MNALCARLIKGVEGHIVIDGDAISRDRAASLVSPSVTLIFLLPTQLPSARAAVFRLPVC
jgi:hypothetical protein